MNLISGSDGSMWRQDFHLVSFDRNTSLMRYKSQHVADLRECSLPGNTTCLSNLFLWCFLTCSFIVSLYIGCVDKLLEPSSRHSVTVAWCSINSGTPVPVPSPEDTFLELACSVKRDTCTSYPSSHAETHLFQHLQWSHCCACATSWLSLVIGSYSVGASQTAKEDQMRERWHRWLYQCIKCVQFHFIHFEISISIQYVYIVKIFAYIYNLRIYIYIYYLYYVSISDHLLDAWIRIYSFCGKNMTLPMASGFEGVDRSIQQIPYPKELDESCIYNTLTNTYKIRVSSVPTQVCFHSFDPGSVYRSWFVQVLCWPMPHREKHHQIHCLACWLRKMPCSLEAAEARKAWSNYAKTWCHYTLED